MANQALEETDFLRDLQEFVSEKWRQNPCDRCGTYQWSTLPGNATVLNVNASTPRPERGFHYKSASSQNVEFIPVYCDNCGNTVSIYVGVFDEWRKRRQTT